MGLLCHQVKGLQIFINNISVFIDCGMQCACVRERACVCVYALEVLVVRMRDPMF